MKLSKCLIYISIGLLQPLSAAAAAAAAGLTGKQVSSSLAKTSPSSLTSVASAYDFITDPERAAFFITLFTTQVGYKNCLLYTSDAADE